ncbi:DNA phosphorothioation-dependent restriction protein DptH [Cohnella boryungensis]|uniref:DNA phosphorothioation-dependent restriction protein DptH n=1 Tax=Cohnella boryungensis TaxID=768479 RepID=A0ABV8SFR2_9BACL
MSNLFYKYISSKIINFFEVKPPQPGDKYHIMFEQDEQVQTLYDVLKNHMNVQPFLYVSEKTYYETYYFVFNHVRLIVSATIDQIKPDFLTFLRNKVVTTDDIQFSNTAILFIHNTSLDSLVKGTESFQKEGMPFHIKTIVKDIKNMLKSSNLSRVERIIVEYALEKKNKDVFVDNSSLFEYEELLEVMSTSGLAREQYRSFGMFYDSNLHELSTKDIKERIKENVEYFSKVDSIHKFGNPDQELEKYFDEKGIELLTNKDWNEVEYKDVRNSAYNKNRNKTLEYIESNKKYSEENVVYWEKSEGDTKIKSRIRNIIVFNIDKLEEINLELSFDDFIKKEFLKVDKNSEIVAEPGGKKIKLKIRNIAGKTGFSKIIYAVENTKFEFRIAVVECDENVLEAIKTNYSILISTKGKYIVANCGEQNLIINPNGTDEVKETLIKVENTVEIFDVDQRLEIINSVENFDDESELIKLELKYMDTIIPITLKEEIDKPKVITGVSLWKLKRENKEHFIYKGNNKLIHGTKEFYAREEFRENIEREKEIIKASGLFFTETSEGLQIEDLDIDPDLKQCYKNLIAYCKVNNLLPSLSYFNDEIAELANKYILQFINCIEEINDGALLSTRQRNLMKLGTIENLNGDREIIFTPLHPLNIAYQIIMNNAIKDEVIHEEILKRLSPINLLPYIYNDEKEIYKPIEQNHSPEWTYYLNSKIQRYNGSRDFVSKLVSEKIDEFIEHFSYLFSSASSAPMKINLINLGDCREVLQGLFEYYVKELRKNPKIEELRPIELCIYGEEDAPNAFEEISFYENPQVIKNTFDVRLDSEHYSEEDILNVFREKVQFYMKDASIDGYQYCHVTLCQMDSLFEITSSEMRSLNTGVSLDGLMSGVPSVYIGDSYRTGFGSKHLNENGSVLLDLAIKINALAKAARSSDHFKPEECIITAVSEKYKKSFDKIYDSSHWITFIEPKVNLNFFKNDIHARDLLIIHYSDQYTSSSGYDAITVTRRSKQYQVIIEEFLREKNVHGAKEYSPRIINFFNAVNGDWLLRLIAHNGQFPREKLSVLSALKIALSYFHHKDIIWIPISLEEVLRVSGGAGLKKSEGLFSSKILGEKQGSYSDDLLLIGIEKCNHVIKVHYYPIEVKIGNNDSGTINKALEQAYKTRKLIEENLKEDNSSVEKNANVFTKKVYRNFLIQLAIVSAEKMKLYDVWPNQNWDQIIDSDLRTQLLSDNYEISNDLDEFVGKGAVISFKKDIHFKNSYIQNEVLVLEFPEQDGYNYITQEIEIIKDKFLTGQSDFQKSDLLFYKYSACNESFHENIQSHVIEQENQPQVRVQEFEEKESSMIGHEDIMPDSENNVMKIVFGNNVETGLPIRWYPTSTDKLMHTNTGIIGTMGTGKTQFTKSLITQLSKSSLANVNGTEIGILVFDYKGDYIKEDFTTATNAKVLELYHLPYNPLSMYITNSNKPLLPLHTANNLKETISTAFNLGFKQEAILKDIILEAYENKGISRTDSSTWSILAPTLNDVYNIYVKKESIKEDSLYAALTNLVDFEIFEPDPNKTKPLFEMLTGVTVINLSGYDEGIQNLVVAITLDIFYNQMQMAGHSSIQGNLREITKMILVDEADNFLGKDFKSIKKIMKEGREYGVGTILSTQLLSHFSTADNEFANYIYTWIVHNVSDIGNKDVKFIFNTKSKAEEDNIINKIKKLEKHYSIVNLEGNQPVLIRDKAFWELIKEL